MAKLKFVKLDVLKPNNLTKIDLAKAVAEVDDSFSVKIEVVEKDRETETIRMMIDGNEIDIDEISKVIEKAGATIHSIDAITVGSEKK